MIKAVVFDCDGLLVDTESAWYEAYEEVLAGYGFEISLTEFAVSIGGDDSPLVRFIRDNDIDTLDVATVAEEIRQLHDKKMAHPNLLPGVKDYLQAAQAAGLRIALASSSNHEWVEGYTRKLGIFDFFEVIKTGDQVEKVKPDPALYREAVTALGVMPSEAVAFEDSLNGLNAALAAGLHCVVVPNRVTSHFDFQGHALRLTSMEEMPLERVLASIAIAI